MCHFGFTGAYDIPLLYRIFFLLHLFNFLLVHGGILCILGITPGMISGTFPMSVPGIFSWEHSWEHSWERFWGIPESLPGSIPGRVPGSFLRRKN